MHGHIPAHTVYLHMHECAHMHTWTQEESLAHNKYITYTYSERGRVMKRWRKGRRRLKTHIKSKSLRCVYSTRAIWVTERRVRLEWHHLWQLGDSINICVSLGFCCCDKTQWPKATWGGKHSFCLYFQVTVHPWGKQGQELSGAGTWMQDLKQKPERNAIYCFTSHDWFSLLSQITQKHMLRDSSVHLPSQPLTTTTHYWLSPPTSTIHQEKCLPGCLQANLMDTFSQLSFLYSHN